MILRICTKCSQSKPETAFARNGKNGLHTGCKRCACEAAKMWRASNPEAAKERDRLKHEKHRESNLIRMREYNVANAEKRGEIERARYEREKDNIKERVAKYRKDNPSLIRAWNNGRRANEKRATPGWADYQGIAKFYSVATETSVATGEKHHVDHIIPLNGKLVCGLHVQHNLQVISATENLKKGHRFECA